jgi:NADH:ubiquinone oxidoreductase subunit 2 (subunit N)
MEIASGFLSDYWWQWVYNSYSMSIVGIPLVVGFILKLIAIIKPSVPTGAILDLFAEYWPSGKPKEKEPPKV